MSDPLIADLKLWRIRMGISQREVGERMGISQQAVSRLESGKQDPYMSTLRRYCLSIGVIIRHDLKETQ